MDLNQFVCNLYDKLSYDEKIFLIKTLEDKKQTQLLYRNLLECTLPELE